MSGFFDRLLVVLKICFLFLIEGMASQLTVTGLSLPYSVSAYQLTSSVTRANLDRKATLKAGRREGTFSFLFIAAPVC